MDTFSLLSLNTFGIPLLSQGRIKRIARELNRVAPSVLCLQEIQQNTYLHPLRVGLSAYSDCAYYRNLLVPKGGLFTALTSDCKMVSSSFLPYPNQGKALSIGFSDWALNKGVLVTTLEAFERRFVIMNTHLQANYLADWRFSNKQTKIQVDQVSYLADQAKMQPDDAWVVVCGDFNFPRQAPVYQTMSAQSGLTDAFAGDPRPTYRPFPLVSKKWHTNLDYIFYRAPTGDSAEIAIDVLPVLDESAKNTFRRFLTDHHALIIKLHFN